MYEDDFRNSSQLNKILSKGGSFKPSNTPMTGMHVKQYPRPFFCASFSDVPGDRGHRDAVCGTGGAAGQSDRSDRQAREDTDDVEPGSSRQPPHTALPREDVADERTAEDPRLPGDGHHGQTEHSRETRKMVQLAVVWWRPLVGCSGLLFG